MDVRFKSYTFDDICVGQVFEDYNGDACMKIKRILYNPFGSENANLIDMNAVNIMDGTPRQYAPDDEVRLVKGAFVEEQK